MTILEFMSWREPYLGALVLVSVRTADGYIWPPGKIIAILDMIPRAYEILADDGTKHIVGRERVLVLNSKPEIEP